MAEGSGRVVVSTLGVARVFADGPIRGLPVTDSLLRVTLDGPGRVQPTPEGDRLIAKTSGAARVTVIGPDLRVTLNGPGIFETVGGPPRIVEIEDDAVEQLYTREDWKAAEAATFAAWVREYGEPAARATFVAQYGAHPIPDSTPWTRGSRPFAYDALVPQLGCTHVRRVRTVRSAGGSVAREMTTRADCQR